MPLSVRAFCIEAPSGQRMAWAVLDVAAVSASWTELVRDGIARSRLGLSAGDIFVSAIHAHTAPVTTRWQTWDPVLQEPLPAYLELITRNTREAVQQAITDLGPARLDFARTTCDIGFNRHYDNDAYDKTLDVLQATNPRGQVLGTIFTYGCHPVSEGASTEISPDFPGYARLAVERETGGRSIFLQGCAGSVNPIRGLAADVIGGKLADEVVTALSTRMRVSPQMTVRRSSASLPLNRPIGAAALTKYRTLEGPAFFSSKTNRQLAHLFAVEESATRRWAQLVTDERARGTLPNVLSAQLGSVRFGSEDNGLRIVNISHEVISEYGPKVRRLFQDRHVTVCGYTGACACYLPTAQYVAENNGSVDVPRLQYESGGGQKWYGLPAPFLAEVEESLLSSLSKL
jgi:hypothetical protein